MDECVTLCFNKLEFPLPNHANLIEAGTVGWEKVENVKKITDRLTDRQAPDKLG